MKKITLFTFAGLLTLSTQGFGVTSGLRSQAVDANSIEAEYSFNINSDFLTSNATKALDSFFQELNFSIPSYSVGSNPTVQIKDLKIKVSPRGYRIFSTANGIGFSSQNNTANVEVGTITINETIRKEFGGVVADIQIFASCEGVKMKLSDSNSNITGELIPVIDANLITAKIKNPVIELGAPKLDITSAKCTGAQGFENEIKATLEKTLNDKKMTQEIVKTQFLANLDAMTRGISYKWNSIQKILDLPMQDNKKISLWITPKKIVPTTKGYQSTGTLKVRFPYEIQGNNFFPLAENNLSAFSNQNFIVVSDEAILALIQNYFTPQEWIFREQANNFQGFASLLSSRFQQFFAWGDLMKWPRSSIFPLVATMQTLPAIAFTSANSVSIQSRVNIDMYGQKPGSVIEKYVQFKMPLSSSMQFSLEQDQINFKLTNSNLSLKYAFDFDYCVHHYKPSYVSEKDYAAQYNFMLMNKTGGCSSINTSVISSSITSFLSNKAFSFPVPTLNTMGGAVIRATSLKRLPDQKVMMLQFGN
jgi:hypothetical protein